MDDAAWNALPTDLVTNRSVTGQPPGEGRSKKAKQPTHVGVVVVSGADAPEPAASSRFRQPSQQPGDDGTVVDDPVEEVIDEYLAGMDVEAANEAKADTDAVRDVARADDDVWELKSGMKWKPVAAGLLQMPDANRGPERQPQFPSVAHLSLAEITPLVCFQTVWPRAITEIMYTQTKRNGEAHGCLSSLDMREIHQFLGVCLAIGLCHASVPRRELWRAKPTGVQPGWNFGELTGMSFSRFNNITRFLRIWDAETNDAWFPVRQLIAAFNRNMVNVMMPGTNLCVDELMIAWRGVGGQDGHHDRNGLPHVSKIIRKPVPVGLEMKASADAASRIILQLELQEGKTAMGKKEFVRECGKSTASVLRLVRPWLTLMPTESTLPTPTHKVHADSAFASVATAVALRRRGMDFAGPVKTAHSNFPRAILLSNLDDDSVPRGTYQAAVGEFSDGGPAVRLAAVGWKDAKVQTFIDTNASTEAGVPALKRRKSGEGLEQREVFESVSRPLCVQKAHDSLNAIDVANHFRQDGLSMETAFRTHTWWVRVFMSVLGIATTNAYLFYKAVHQQRNANQPFSKSFHDFVNEVATALCDLGREVGRPANVRRARALGQADRDAVAQLYGEYNCVCDFRSLEVAPATEARRERKRKRLLEAGELNMNPSPQKPKVDVRRRCEICQEKATFYCVAQHGGNGNGVVCGPSTGRGSKCLVQHVLRHLRE